MRVHIFILMLFFQAQAAPAESLTRYLNPVRPQDPEAPVQRWIRSLHQFLDRPVLETRNLRIGILPFGAIEIRFK
jgi:hypothetical protein